MANPQFKHITLKDSNGVAVVDFVNSELMYESTVVNEIGDELHSLVLTHGYTKILLDFKNVQYLSSTMLAKLAKLDQLVQHAKGHLRLCRVGPVLMDTFRIGHFERVFDLYDDADSALKAF